MTDMESNVEIKTSSAQLRKIKKPIIERRRRERINESLNQLKTLVLDALNKDESRFSKMEKADILEMTVKHLKSLHKQHSCSSSAPPSPSPPAAAAAPTAAPLPASRYTAGFSECALEVKRYLSMASNLAPDVQTRLMNHLSHVVVKSNSPAVPMATSAMALPGGCTKTRVVPVLSPLPPSSTCAGLVTIVPAPEPLTRRPQGSSGTTVCSTAPSGGGGGGDSSSHSIIPLYINTSISTAYAKTDEYELRQISSVRTSPKAASEAPRLITITPVSPSTAGQDQYEQPGSPHVAGSRTTIEALPQVEKITTTTTSSSNSEDDDDRREVVAMDTDGDIKVDHSHHVAMETKLPVWRPW